MVTKAVKELLSRFLVYTEREVLQTFASLKGAEVGKDDSWVFVPGTRKDRVLLVAHADTVNDNAPPPNIMWVGDVCTLRSFWRGEDNKRVYDPKEHTASVAGYYSSLGRGGNVGRALGADDRAGCAAMWEFRDSGHSLLITTGEEHGCVGARAAALDIPKLLKAHTFALEIDRRGDHQVVFYDVATKAFAEYILGLLGECDRSKDGWYPALGSVTDIKVICNEIGICGVNLSAGYVEEHTSRETLYAAAWMHTFESVKSLLKYNHRQFLLPKAPPVVYHSKASGQDWCYKHGQKSSDCKKWHDSSEDVKGDPEHARIIRIGGTAPGQGIVKLWDLGKAPNKLSRRQSKKIAGMIARQLGKRVLSQDEANQLLQTVIALRDRKTQVVTEAEREAARSGAVDHYIKQRPTPNSLFTHGEFDPASGKCHHLCGMCSRRWWHYPEDGARGCVPAYNCLCPTHGSPNIIKMIATSAWGYEHLPVPAGKEHKMGSIVTCGHHCDECHASWTHIKSEKQSGRCRIRQVMGGIKALCPNHSMENAMIVLDYEVEAGVQIWTSRLKARGVTLTHKITAPDDPDGAEPAKGDKSQLVLLDGKSGAGLRSNSKREGELLN